MHQMPAELHFGVCGLHPTIEGTTLGSARPAASVRGVRGTAHPQGEIPSEDSNKWMQVTEKVTNGKGAN